ncbi:sensor histidine kinase [Tellurirhabdus rosea]|uniref:sensor histidine kinase n=1 Tax=Tellurirhabdus rosea TaxID=2674997 RepID=UPI0022518D07|nr:histidine kinase [Tellurirhabdus rosea]
MKAFWTLRNKIFLAVFLTFSFGLVIVREVALPEVDWGWHLLDFTATTGMILVGWGVTEVIHRTLNRWLPLEKHLWWRLFIQISVSKVFATILFGLGNLIVLPLLPGIEAHLTRPTLVLLVLVVLFAIFLINAALIAEHFLIRWKEDAVRAARLEQEKAQVQFDNLKNQLNPHFLFNSLSSLDGLIHENPELASQFLRQLSKVFRYVLQHKDKDLVSLSTELDFVKNYIFLLKTRFNGSLQIEVNITDEDADKQIVPLTIQSLVENALKHNTANAAHPLHIRVYTADHHLTVENGLQQKQNVETSNQQGLKNLKALYQFLTREPIRVGEREGKFVVSVPLVNGKALPDGTP